MTVVIGLLHGATFLSNLPLVLFVSFIGPWQLERTPIKPHLHLLRYSENLSTHFSSSDSTFAKIENLTYV